MNKRIKKKITKRNNRKFMDGYIKHLERCHYQLDDESDNDFIDRITENWLSRTPLEIELSQRFEKKFAECLGVSVDKLNGVSDA